MLSRNSNHRNNYGFRVSWSSGNRKRHHKKQHASTTASGKCMQKEDKKYDMWSFNGGGRTPKDITQTDVNKSLLPNGSTSSSSPQVSHKRYPGKAEVASKPNSTSASAASPSSSVAIDNSTEDTDREIPRPPADLELSKKYVGSGSDHTTATSPNSTASTVPLESPNEEIDIVSVTVSEESAMPAQNQSPLTEVNSVSNAANMDEKLFSMLDKNLNRPNDFDVFTLPSPPTSFTNSEDNLTSQSSIVATTQETPSPSPRKHNILQNGVINNTMYSNKMEKNQHSIVLNPNRNQYNQGDVNSIESITEDTMITDAKMIELLQDKSTQEETKVASKTKRKRKKKYANVKELDQLDGVTAKGTAVDTPKEDDERVVQCLYYTLMCCDCTIS